jgi:uncharacterized metal-binding protein
VGQHSDGYYHSMMTIAASPICGVVAVGIGRSLFADVGFSTSALFWLGVGLGLFQIIMSPDLDQEINISRTIFYKPHWLTMIWLLGYVWSALWHIYGKVFTHRGISHWPIFGTATRYIYLAAWLIALKILLGIIGIELNYPVHNRELIMIILISFPCIAIGDFLHYVRDYWLT